MDKEQITDLCHALRLTEPEARLYLAALQYQKANVTQLAKAANIPRTALYQPLEKLVERGMLSVVTVGKRKHYSALDPQQLHRILEEDRLATYVCHGCVFRSCVTLLTMRYAASCVCDEA